MKKFIEKSLIELMITDSFKQDKIFSAGNYWKKYEKKILKQIKENDLEEFRSWPGGAGVGNIQSFGGGDLALIANSEEISIRLKKALKNLIIIFSLKSIMH